MNSVILSPMRRRRLIALLLLVLFVASVSYSSSYTLDIVDSNGRPRTAYAIYHHQGESLNPVHPVSYDATPTTVLRSDENGHLRIPAAFHLHLPFPLQTPPKLWIDMVYVPELHNAGGRISPGYAATATGSWEMDASRHRAVVYDSSDHPERWQNTLSNLSFNLSPAVRDVKPSKAALVVELIEHFRQEYKGFLARHYGAPRPLPRMPQLFTDDEKRRWKEMVDKDLGERPTWGMEMERLHESEISTYAVVEANLKRGLPPYTQN